MAGEIDFLKKQTSSADIDALLEAAVIKLEGEKNPILALAFDQVSGNAGVIDATQKAKASEDAALEAQAVSGASNPFAEGEKNVPAILKGSILNNIPSRITSRGKLR